MKWIFRQSQTKPRQKLTSPNKAKNTQIIACWYKTYIRQIKKKMKKREKKFWEAASIGLSAVLHLLRK
jgi:hypothetical protein